MPDRPSVKRTPYILIEAAGLWARQRLRTPDAIQLATAIRTGATLVVTNDDVWRGLPFIDTAILGDMIEKA